MARARWKRPPAAVAPVASKYGNVRINGFASKREYRRFLALELLQRSGQIIKLARQVYYELIPPQPPHERAVGYIADFVYETSAGETVVEDAKAVRTPAYIIKRKLMLWRHAILIREV